MRRYSRIFSFVPLLLFASAALADIGDGASFLSQCSEESLKKIHQQDQREYLYKLNYCVIFVTGVIHGHYASRAAYKQKPLFCLPPKLSPVELTGSVVAIIQMAPEKQDLFAAALALQGLAESYPCKN